VLTEWGPRDSTMAGSTRVTQQIAADRVARVPDEIAGDVRAILGGLNSVVNGVGSLRTHAGDAHGRERGYRRIDSRFARLAIHSASTASLFLVETWQKQFPTRQLKSH
jgi:hypothetical protein